MLISGEGGEVIHHRNLHFSVLIQHPKIPTAAQTADNVMLPRDASMMIIGILNPTIEVAKVITSFIDVQSLCHRSQHPVLQSLLYAEAVRKTFSMFRQIILSVERAPILSPLLVCIVSLHPSINPVHCPRIHGCLAFAPQFIRALVAQLHEVHRVSVNPIFDFNDCGLLTFMAGRVHFTGCNSHLSFAQ